jgi:hypothetical protein
MSVHRIVRNPPPKGRTRGGLCDMVGGAGAGVLIEPNVATYVAYRTRTVRMLHGLKVFNTTFGTHFGCVSSHTAVKHDLTMGLIP